VAGIRTDAYRTLLITGRLTVRVLLDEVKAFDDKVRSKFNKDSTSACARYKLKSDTRCLRFAEKAGFYAGLETTWLEEIARLLKNAWQAEDEEAALEAEEEE
jgi:hypothetical protein